MSRSLPVRECGLKLIAVRLNKVDFDVTPRAGVWIETCRTWRLPSGLTCHSPCGSVD